eukprot:g5541.t1
MEVPETTEDDEEKGGSGSGGEGEAGERGGDAGSGGEEDDGEGQDAGEGGGTAKERRAAKKAARLKEKQEKKKAKNKKKGGKKSKGGEDDEAGVDASGEEGGDNGEDGGKRRRKDRRGRKGDGSEGGQTAEEEAKEDERLREAAMEAVMMLKLEAKKKGEDMSDIPSVEEMFLKKKKEAAEMKAKRAKGRVAKLLKLDPEIKAEAAESVTNNMYITWNQKQTALRALGACKDKVQLAAVLTAVLARKPAEKIAEAPIVAAYHKLEIGNPQRTEMRDIIGKAQGLSETQKKAMVKGVTDATTRAEVGAVLGAALAGKLPREILQAGQAEFAFLIKDDKKKVRAHRKKQKLEVRATRKARGELRTKAEEARATADKLKYVVDARNRAHELHVVRRRCLGCHFHEATRWCEQCDMLYCEACSLVVHKDGPHRSHHTEHLEGFHQCSHCRFDGWQWRASQRAAGSAAALSPVAASPGGSVADSDARKDGGGGGSGGGSGGSDNGGDAGPSGEGAADGSETNGDADKEGKEGEDGGEDDNASSSSPSKAKGKKAKKTKKGKGLPDGGSTKESKEGKEGGGVEQAADGTPPAEPTGGDGPKTSSGATPGGVQPVMMESVQHTLVPLHNPPWVRNDAIFLRKVQDERGDVGVYARTEEEDKGKKTKSKACVLL